MLEHENEVVIIKFVFFSFLLLLFVFVCKVAEKAAGPAQLAQLLMYLLRAE